MTKTKNLIERVVEGEDPSRVVKGLSESSINISMIKQRAEKLGGKYLGQKDYLDKRHTFDFDDPKKASQFADDIHKLHYEVYIENGLVKVRDQAQT